MKEHGGQMDTVPIGEYPALSMLAATAEGLGDEDAWKQKKTTVAEDTVAATERLAASEKIGLMEAYGRVIDKQVRGVG